MEILEVEEDKKENKQEVKEISSESFTKKSPEVEEITDLFSIFPNLNNKEISEDKKITEEAPRVSKKVVFNIKLMEGILDDLFPTFNELFHSEKREEIPVFFDGKFNIFSGNLAAIRQGLISGATPTESQIKIINDFELANKTSYDSVLELKSPSYFKSARVDSVFDLKRLIALCDYSLDNSKNPELKEEYKKISLELVQFDLLVFEIYNMFN